MEVKIGRKKIILVIIAKEMDGNKHNNMSIIKMNGIELYRHIDKWIEEGNEIEKHKIESDEIPAFYQSIIMEDIVNVEDLIHRFQYGNNISTIDKHNLGMKNKPISPNNLTRFVIEISHLIIIAHGSLNGKCIWLSQRDPKIYSDKYKKKIMGECENHNTINKLNIPILSRAISPYMMPDATIYLNICYSNKLYIAQDISDAFGRNVYASSTAIETKRDGGETDLTVNINKSLVGNKLERLSSGGPVNVEYSQKNDALILVTPKKPYEKPVGIMKDAPPIVVDSVEDVERALQLAISNFDRESISSLILKRDEDRVYTYESDVIDFSKYNLILDSEIIKLSSDDSISDEVLETILQSLQKEREEEIVNEDFTKFNLYYESNNKNMIYELLTIKDKLFNLVTLIELIELVRRDLLPLELLEQLYAIQHNRFKMKRVSKVKLSNPKSIGFRSIEDYHIILKINNFLAETEDIIFLKELMEKVLFPYNSPNDLLELHCPISGEVLKILSWDLNICPWLKEKLEQRIYELEQIDIDYSRNSELDLEDIKRFEDVEQFSEYVCSPDHKYEPLKCLNPEYPCYDIASDRCLDYSGNLII